MNLPTIFLLASCVSLLSIGQLLFKLSAKSFPATFSLDELTKFFFNKYFLLAIVIYALATFLWVWALSKVPLSRAYPFMALAFVIVPLISHLLLGEKLSSSIMLGSSIIVVGLLVAVN